MRGRRSCWRRRWSSSSNAAMPPPAWRTWPGAPASPRAPCTCISPIRKNCSRPWCGDNIVATIGEAEQDAATFDGPSGELLGALLMKWWEEICATPLGGITKLMLAEGNNFPELAQFYNDEVVARGSSLFTRVLTRGIERGEFRPVDPVVMTQVLIAPVIMLMMWTHSFMPTCDMPQIPPQEFMDVFIATTLRGLKADTP